MKAVNIRDSITIEPYYGQPSIDGFVCTFDTKEIRSNIEGIFEVNRTFVLPLKYDYEIRPSAFYGKVAKIKNNEN